MKQLLFFSFLFLLVAIPQKGSAVNPSNQKSTLITKKDLEKQLGRKLKFKEKVALKLLQIKQKKQATPSKQKIDGFAIAGFSSAPLLLLSLLIGQPVLYLIFTAAAIILSVIGLYRTKGLKGSRKRGRALATLGLLVGIISVLALSILLIALAGAF